MRWQRSIDSKARRLLDEVLKQPYGEHWWELRQLIRENPLELKTHGLVAQKMRFRDDDVPVYVHGLINQHGDKAIPLIEQLLLRPDLDCGGGDVAIVLELLADLPTSEMQVAALATNLLTTFKPEPPYKHPPFRSSDLKPDPDYFSPIADTVAGLLALAHRGESSGRVPEAYAWCLAQSQPSFYGLRLFYRLLKPTQTQQVLRAIQRLADGKGLFLARSRDIPGAAEHLALSHLDTDIGDIASLTRALLRSVDPEARGGAAAAFGMVGGREAIEALITALGDPWESVREAAAGALARLGSDALPALLEALRSGHHHNEDAYTELMRRASIPTRLWGDQRQVHWVQECAAEALGKMRDERAVDGLSTALNGEYSEWVRPSAAKALGAIGGPRAIDALRRAPRDVHPVVREAIAKALDAAEGRTGS